MKKKYKYEFSVVMTIYNVEKYLEEAIESVINQSIGFEENIEIILVNDGSPDNSEEICLRYKKRFPKNIKYVKKENGGVSSARNAGLDVVSGKYINFLDSDDYFSLNAFESVKKVFDKYYSKTDVLAINLVNFENASGSWVNKDFFSKDSLINMQRNADFMQCQVGASFFRHEAALKYKYDTNIRIHEDSHYLYRIFRDKPFCAIASEGTYFHRIRYQGNSATQTIKHKQNIFSILEYVFIDLIDFYKKKKTVLPKYFQTFVILEFNYYVLNKIAECDFTNEEKKVLLDNIEFILKNINENNIKNHFVLSIFEKRRMLKIKKRIKTIYAIFPNLSVWRTRLFIPQIKQILKSIWSFVKKVFRFVKRILRFIKRLILFIPKRIYRKIFKKNNVEDRK